VFYLLTKFEKIVKIVYPIYVQRDGLPRGFMGILAHFPGQKTSNILGLWYEKILKYRKICTNMVPIKGSSLTHFIG